MAGNEESLVDGRAEPNQNGSTPNEMAGLIRSFDWSKTPLGPRDQWPTSLLTIVNTLVASRFPMALLWGQELILLYNDACRAICADKHPAALGRSTREIWSEVWHINEPIFAAVMERGETLHFEDKLFPINRRGYNEDAWFTLCYSPVRVEDEGIGGTLVVLQERTRAERVMQARLRLLEQSFHCSLEQLLVATLDEGEQLTGSAIGFYHFVEPDQRTLSLQAWSTRTSREFCTAEGRGRHYDVAQAGVWVDCVAARRPVVHNDYAALPHRKGLPPGHAPVTRELVVPVLRHGRIVAILGVGNKPGPYDDADVETVSHLADLAWDIAQRKQIEAELVQAKDAAEAANRAKSEFLANLSHEIRMPMTAVLGYAELLLASEDTPAGHRAHLEILQRNGQSLLELINTILDLAKIESGRLDAALRECSPAALVDEVVSLFAVQSRKKGLWLEVEHECPLPETIRTDPDRLRQILVNLVGNAVKFTERGGVRIRVYLADGPGATRTLHFAVCDTGIGISAEQREKLFKRFSQADSTRTRDFGGTGLGLAISKRLAELLGGDIRVESEPGIGSTFTLQIGVGTLSNVPMLSGRMSPATTPAAASGWQTLEGRVLLAEDQVDNRRVMQLLLEKAGLSVDLAENGVDACRKAACSLVEGSPYDVICMDIQMPAMDGYETTARLRRVGWKRPIIAVTARAMAGEREKCLAAGCDDYLAKPFVRQDLLELIARFLRSHAQTPPVGQSN